MSRADGASITGRQVVRVVGRAGTPDPQADANWWQVPLRGGDRVGWVRIAASVTPPTDQWIAEELSRQARRFGGKLEGRLLGRGGLDLTLAARAAPPSD